MEELIKKIKIALKGTIVLLGSLIGIKRLGKDNYNLSQAYMLGFVFFFTTPLFIAFGNGVLLTWLSLLAIGLILINVDEAFMLVSLYAEFGVEETLNLGDYKKCIQDSYFSSTYSVD